MRVSIGAILVVLAAASAANAAEIIGNPTALERLGAALTAGDEPSVKTLLSEDAKVISYFDKTARYENLAVLLANFEGLKRIPQATDDQYLAYNMCDGTTAYSLQIKEQGGKIVEVRYGTALFSPPPIPYSMRKTMVRCKPPVRIVQDPSTGR